MTFRTRCEIAKGSIDPAPMVDVVFLLLIFLVLSSPYVLVPGFGQVELPVVATASSASFQNLVVTVGRDNLIFFQNQVTTLESLKQALRAAARQSRNAELIIKADSQVSHGTIVQIMSMAYESGITAVNLATRPDVSHAAPVR